MESTANPKTEQLKYQSNSSASFYTGVWYQGLCKIFFKCEQGEGYTENSGIIPTFGYLMWICPYSIIPCLLLVVPRVPTDRCVLNVKLLFITERKSLHLPKHIYIYKYKRRKKL